MKHFILSITFAVAVMVILTSCEKKKPAPIPPGVVVTPVVEDDVTRVWELVGQTVSDPKVDLRARVEGFLEKRNFKQGAFVKSGELLFQIEKDVYKAQLLQAKGSVDIQKAVLKNAQIEYDRKKLLRDKNTISQAEFDKATADKDSAIGALEEADATYKKAQLNLSYTDIKSPIKGRIGLAKYNVGNLVGPSSDVLATVVALDPIYVEFNVSEATFVEAQQESVQRKISMDKLLKSLDLELVLSNDTKYPHTGKICFWDNQTNSSTGTVLNRAEFKNPDYILMPGQYVTVKVKSNVAKKSLVIPQVAIQSALGGKFVMVVNKENIVEYRNVKTGYRFDSSIVIKEGLQAGERVITQGIQKVRPGMKVKPTRDIPVTKDKSTQDQNEPVAPENTKQTTKPATTQKK